MSMVAEYIDKFFTKGKIIVRTKGLTYSDEDKKLFNSIIESLQLEHPVFVETCNREKILKIDNKNLIIELIV